MKAWTFMQLSDGPWVLIDAADFGDLGRWRWRSTGKGYAARSTRKGKIYLHRYVLGLVRGDGLHGDHRNRNKLDNRRCNLRVTTPAQNCQNVPGHVTRSSRFRGVSLDPKSGRWRAYCQVNGKQKELGRYDDEEEAAEIVRVYREEHMNFSEEET